MKKQAFTLIELLVVIAIIALLLSVIMPAINKAKQIAAAAVCLSNCGQMSKAYYTYAEENNGFITDGKPATTSDGYMSFDTNGGGRNDYRTRCFVANPMDAAGNYRNETLEDKIRGFQQGGLWPYLQSPDIYNCPVDKRWLKEPIFPGSSADKIGGYRSYSIGGVLSAGAMYGDSGTVTTGENKAVILKYSDFTNPSSKIVFLEEADQSGKNDNYWNMYFTQRRWWDPFAIWHNGTSTFGYADGHADRHRWTDKNMIAMAAGELGKGQMADTNSDDYEVIRRIYTPGRVR
jgi:prepilin-type N-terminal cleavage/methylation domain-containing protein/prepilin-type processing-associated H-X9-DG protein